MADTRPQVLTLTAGAQSVTLDTATVARAVDVLMQLWSDAVLSSEHDVNDNTYDDAYDLLGAITDVCGPDHLDAVREWRDGVTTTTTTED